MPQEAASADVHPIAVEHAGHRHILEIIRAEGGRAPRLLDMGCGTGKILALISTHFPQADCYGYDVNDSGVQPDGYMQETLSRLQSARVDIDWGRRISVISSRQAWPYDDGFFDLIVSDQVIEHVTDPDLAFAEMARTLRPGGKAIHVFPTQHSMVEWHRKVPFIHWMRNASLRRRYMSFFFPKTAQGECDVLWRDTHYLKQSGLYELCRRNNLRCSFAYTHNLYLTKLGLRPKYRRSLLGDWLLPLFLRYAYSVTMLVEKP